MRVHRKIPGKRVPALRLAPLAPRRPAPAAESRAPPQAPGLRRCRQLQLQLRGLAVRPARARPRTVPGRAARASSAATAVAAHWARAASAALAAAPAGRAVYSGSAAQRQTALRARPWRTTALTGTSDTMLDYDGGVTLNHNFATANGCMWMTQGTTGNHLCTGMMGCTAGSASNSALSMGRTLPIREIRIRRRAGNISWFGISSASGHWRAACAAGQLFSSRSIFEKRSDC